MSEEIKALRRLQSELPGAHIAMVAVRNDGGGDVKTKSCSPLDMHAAALAAAAIDLLVAAERLIAGHPSRTAVLSKFGHVVTAARRELVAALAGSPETEATHAGH